MRALCSLLMTIVVAGCAHAGPPTSAVERKRDPMQSLFDFHVGLWVNLHQRLYAESGTRPVRDPLVAATAEEQAAWNAAVAFYRQRYADRGLLTLLEHPELVNVNRVLANAERAANLAAVDLPLELRTVLERVAPIYRRQLWPADERLAHDLIARLSPLVNRFGPALQPALVRVYQSPWPSAPIRVDIAAYAGPVGAYTLDSPPHIMMSSQDPRHAGAAALEILFHEASHVLIAPVERVIASACAEKSQPVPPTLWHAILFYTAGELVRRELGPAYVPYADRNGLWARSPEWTQYRPLLERLWTPYLDGRQPLSKSVGEIVAALPNQAGAPRP